VILEVTIDLVLGRTFMTTNLFTGHRRTKVGEEAVIGRIAAVGAIVKIIPAGGVREKEINLLKAGEQ